MAKLIKKADTLNNQKKAPEKSGASSDSVGMSTKNNDALVPGSKEKKKKDEKKKEEVKKVKADIEVSFYLPFAMEGKSNVNVPFPYVDRDGKLTNKVEYKQIELTDKFFTAFKKDMKNSAYWKRYKELMIESGFEMFDSIKNLKELNEFKALEASKPVSVSKEKKRQKVFGAFRPEHLTSESSFAFAFQCDDKVRTFQEVKGRLFTDDPIMHKIFLKNGFEDMGYVKDSQKLSKEIIVGEKDE